MGGCEQMWGRVPEVERGGWMAESESEMRKRRDEMSPIRINTRETGSPMPVAVAVPLLLLYKSPSQCPVNFPVPHPFTHPCPLPPPPLQISTDVSHFPVRSSDACISSDISCPQAPLFPSSPTKSGRHLSHPRPIIPFLLDFVFTGLCIYGYRGKSP